MSFTGGKLKLKGGSDLPGVAKKKKKSSSSANATALTLVVEDGGTSSKDDAAADQKKALHGYSLQSPTEADDRRTAAEKKYDEHMKKMEGERLRKLAQKSHRLVHGMIMHSGHVVVACIIDQSNHSNTQGED